MGCPDQSYGNGPWLLYRACLVDVYRRMKYLGLEEAAAGCSGQESVVPLLRPCPLQDSDPWLSSLSLGSKRRDSQTPAKFCSQRRDSQTPAKCRPKRRDSEGPLGVSRPPLGQSALGRGRVPQHVDVATESQHGEARKHRF